MTDSFARVGLIWSALAPALASALASALAVVLPTECVGCGAPDHPVCPACAATLVTASARPGRARAVELQIDAGRAPPLRVWAAQPYAGVLRSALSAFKEHGRTDVSAMLGRVLQVAVQDAASAVCAGAAGAAVAASAAGAAGSAGTADIAVTAELPSGAALELTVAPSSRAAFRSRGYHPVDLLARRARSGSPVVRTLQVARTTADQAGLGIDARRVNLERSMRVRRTVSGGLAGRHFLLIDDVVTTGSTLLECRRALEHEGATVWGAATLAFAEKHVGMSAVRRISEPAGHIM